jgi:chromosome segregation ATPase
MSKITVRQAAKLTGKSRETINTATRDGTLSYTLNAQKHKVIDISELERVYPLVKTFDDLKSESGAVRKRPAASDSDANEEIAVLRQKLAGSEAMRESLTAERDRERRQLEGDIEHLRSSLEKAQEQHSKALLLITDQTNRAKDRAGDWQDAIDKLKQQIANQETALEKRLADVRQQSKREAIDEIKSKPWWKVIFT